VALLALAAVAWPLKLAARREARDVALPPEHRHPIALAWVGDRLWTADWFSRTVYELRRSGDKMVVVRSVALPQVHIMGLAVAGNSLFLCDPTRRVIEERRLDSNLTLARSHAAPGSRPSSLFYDGRYLWSADSGTGRIYQHEPREASNVLASYPAKSRSVAGIFKDETFFWSADADTRVIYQHRLDTKLRVIATYHLPGLDEGGRPLSAFTRRGNEFWLGRDGADNLLERGAAGFHVRPGS
jgi:hypothetical protein